ncbi:pepsin/retropepsin-like aspartic protease family protein [Evansella halocellulosilytica]|uniref:hypothetical protein n=1 Tax=Evansella halocellulosilytica TaxID=2011013 RepID=UPI000BB6A5E1|nr:hypothetical protein [Evansella halocellulosilytica]
MKNLVEEDGVFVTEMMIVNDKSEVVLSHVLVDTSSKHTVISSESAIKAGLILDHEQEGKSENKEAGFIKLGNITIHDFQIKVKDADQLNGYDGVLGVDFLKKVGAVINLGSLTIYKANVK